MSKLVPLLLSLWLIISCDRFKEYSTSSIIRLSINHPSIIQPWQCSKIIIIYPDMKIFISFLPGHNRSNCTKNVTKLPIKITSTYCSPLHTPNCSIFAYHDINQKKNDQVANCSCAFATLFNLERDGFPCLDWFLQPLFFLWFGCPKNRDVSCWIEINRLSLIIRTCSRKPRAHRGRIIEEVL